jgi:DNA-binding transcriptional MerR regulator
MGEGSGLGIEELAEHAGVPVRTIRYYIAEGLLPGPGARGKAASYSEEHLLRLRLIRYLSEQRVPLTEQRARLSGLSLAEVRALLREEERRITALRRAREAPSPRAYVSALLTRARTAQGAAQTDIPRLREPASSSDVFRYQTSFAPMATPGGAWSRWELAPGVELHVRADAAVQYADLVERLLGAAGAPSDRAPGDRGHSSQQGGQTDDD